MHKNIKTASSDGSKGLVHLANPVHQNTILQSITIKEYVKDQDVDMCRKYIPFAKAKSIRLAKAKSYYYNLQTRNKDLQTRINKVCDKMGVLALAHTQEVIRKEDHQFFDQIFKIAAEYLGCPEVEDDIINEITKIEDDIINKITMNFFTVEEERQLTSFLIQALQKALPSDLIAGNSSILNFKHRQLLCEYATSMPDIIICAEKSAVIINGISAEDEDKTSDSELPNNICGLAIEEKRDKLALNQSIANMHD